MESWLIGTLFCSAFLGTGLLVFFAGLWQLRRIAASPSWPTVKGEITHAAITEGSEHCGAHVKYAYVVKGEKLEGSSISHYDVFYNDRDYALAVLERFPVGRQVQVYVNPDDPAETFLEPGLQRASYAMLAFGLTFALFGSGLLLLFWLSTP